MYEEAIKYEEFEQGSAPIPFLASLYGGLGSVYSTRGDDFNAVLNYSRAQALHPTNLLYSKQMFAIFKDAGLRQLALDIREFFLTVCTFTVQHVEQFKVA